MKKSNKKKGASLITVLMVLLIAMILSSVTLTTISRTTRANGQEKKSEDVLYAAESGLQYGIAWFNTNKKAGTINVPPINGCTYVVKVDPKGKDFLLTSTATIGGKSKTLSVTFKSDGAEEVNGGNILTENTLNAIGDPSNSNNTVYMGHGPDGAFTSKGSVSLQGNSISLGYPMSVDGNLNISSKTSTLLSWDSDLNITGNAYIKSKGETSIYGPISKLNDFIVLSTGNITLKNKSRIINGNVYFRSEGEVKLEGPLNSNKDTTIIAEKTINYSNYQRQIKGNTYIKSRTGEIVVGSPINVDGAATFISGNKYTNGNYDINVTGPLYINSGSDISLQSNINAASTVSVIGLGNITLDNLSRKILGDLYIKAGKDINLKANLSMDSNVYMIANNIFFDWYQFSFLKGTYLKATSQIKMNNPANLGEAYIEARDFYKEKTITSKKIETAVANIGGPGSFNPININVNKRTEPSEPVPPEEPKEPSKAPEIPWYKYQKIDNVNNFINISDNLAYCKLNSSDSNFTNNLKKALSEDLDVGDRYKLLVIEGDCKIDYNIVNSRNITNLKNYIIYVTGEFYNDRNINFKNSVIYSNKINIPYGFLNMTPIKDSPTIPFTEDTKNKVLEYFSKFTTSGSNPGTGGTDSGGKFTIGEIIYN